MRKQTKTGLTRKLDAACSKIIRSKGICSSCLMSDYSKLQCCHIFSRTYRNTRWYLDNMICLCASCHFKAHKNPIKFVERVRKYLGEEKYEGLKEMHNVIKRWTIPDMEELLKNLEKKND